MLYIRLTALRALSGLGEAGACALLTGPSFRRKGESYPFVWALSRCIQPGLFCALQVSPSAAHDLLSRARFLARRAARPHTWRYRLSRASCCEAIAVSEHPLQTLACTVRLLEMHGQDAIPPLLELLRLPPPQVLWDEKAECAAWALGQIGPLAVPEILQEYRNASTRMADHLATALWYLGPAALRAVPRLLKDPSDTATAALLAMEEKASLEMVRVGRGPVWLDEAAVQALAAIAFSDGDRAYAAAALSCFGPAAPAALPILRHLARDPVAEVRLKMAYGLGWGGRPEGMSLLAELAEDSVSQVADRARQSMEKYFASLTDMQAAALRALRSGDEVGVSQGGRSTGAHRGFRGRGYQRLAAGRPDAWGVAAGSEPRGGGSCSLSSQDFGVDALARRGASAGSLARLLWPAGAPCFGTNRWRRRNWRWRPSGGREGV